jgi:hypothetical protein
MAELPLQDPAAVNQPATGANHFASSQVNGFVLPEFHRFAATTTDQSSLIARPLRSATQAARFTSGGISLTGRSDRTTATLLRPLPRRSSSACGFAAQRCLHPAHQHFWQY